MSQFRLMGEDAQRAGDDDCDRSQLSADDVRRQLRKVLASPSFARSVRHGRFLSHLVDAVLENRCETLTEYQLGIDVFDRRGHFDPQQDPIVRVEAGRLRCKLREYLRQHGSEDTIIFELPSRSYVPLISVRPEALVRRRRYGTVDGQPAFAALPFAAAGDAAAAQSAVALTEGVIAALARTPGCRVASRSSTAQFRETPADMRALAQQLGADVVVEGSVRVENDRVRVMSAGFLVPDGWQIWSGSYEGELNELFEVEGDLAGAIAANVLLAARGRPPERYTHRLDAAISAAHGASVLANLDETGAAEAAGWFRRAIAADPQFAPAHSGLAESLVMAAVYGLAPYREALAEAKPAAVRALQLDPTLAEAEMALGLAEALEHPGSAAAERRLRSALFLERDNPMFRCAYTLAVLAPAAKLNRAPKEIATAQELAPVSAGVAVAAAIIHWLRGETASARDVARQALVLNPKLRSAHLVAGLAYAADGEGDEAALALGQAGACPLVTAFLEYARTPEVQRRPASLRKGFEERGLTPLVAALAEAGLNRTRKTVQHAAAAGRRGRALGN